MATATEPLTFSRRARIRETEIATHRRYLSECGRFAIEEVRSKVERNNHGHKLAYWLAIRRLVAGEYIIARTRTRDKATEACQ